MELKPYKATVNGMDTVLMLTAEDAKTRGLSASDVVTEQVEQPDKTEQADRKQAARPANKAAAPGSDKS